MDNQEDFFDDIISDDADLDEIEMSDGDEMDDEMDEDVEVRTVILVKNEMVALLGLKQSAEEAIIVRVDPRQPMPAAQTYDDTAAALKWFNRSLATSKQNGWEIIFDGEPLYG
ncbi:MAG: hypothetical protein QOH63_2220 [Acidobacteriota bacterium]|jgi:hypothetical protein|nr:hypothetical protein [Acidobacteriota bacterium]